MRQPTPQELRRLASVDDRTSGMMYRQSHSAPSAKLRRSWLKWCREYKLRELALLKWAEQIELDKLKQYDQ